MRINAFLPAVLLLGFCCPGSARSAIFHVSPSGNDSNTGLTPEEAWNSVERVNRAAFRAGDSILFEGGQVFAGPVKFGPDDRGTAGEPIVVGSYRLEEAGRATIFAGKGRGIDLRDVSGFRVADLKVVGTGAKSNRESGIVIHTSLPDGAEDVEICNVEVAGFGNHGIAIEARETRTGYSNVRISHCAAHDNLKTGISTWGPWGPGIYAHSQIHVEYSRAYNMSGGSGIVLSSVDGGIIEHCVAYNNGTEFSGAAGIWAWDSNDILIQFNESYANRTIGVDGDGFDFDGGVTNSVMQYNYSHDNDAAGFLLAQYQGAPQAMRNNVIRYNISENDCRNKGYGAIHVWSGDGPEAIDGINIYNNTVYLTPEPDSSEEPSAIAVVTPTTSVAVRNNLFITTGAKALVSVVPGQRRLLFQNNAYWPGGDPFVVNWNGERYESLEEWLAAAPGQERIGGRIVAVNEDPMLAGPGSGGILGDAGRRNALAGYRLLPDSLMLERGLDLRDAFGLDAGEHDFFGNPIPPDAPPAIGAHAVRPEPAGKGGEDQVEGELEKKAAEKEPRDVTT